MNLDRSIRVKIGITLIALSTLVSSVLLLLDKDIGIRDKGYWYYKSIVSLHENRFAGIKNILPANTVAGYITDIQPDKETEKGYGYYLTQYYLTQYVLSPAIIVRGTNYPLVIGNFHKPVNISQIYQDSRLILIRELDNGVMLFRSEKVK